MAAYGPLAVSLLLDHFIEKRSYTTAKADILKITDLRPYFRHTSDLAPSVKAVSVLAVTIHRSFSVEVQIVLQLASHQTFASTNGCCAERSNKHWPRLLNEPIVRV